MHEHELVAIWFLSVSMGMILTMLMPQLVSAPIRRACVRDERTHVPARDEFGEHMGALVQIGKVPAVYLVSTSWAWGLPQAAGEEAVLDHDQSPRMVPPVGQPAYVTGSERTETGSRCAEQEAEDRELVMHHEGA